MKIPTLLLLSLGVAVAARAGLQTDIEYGRADGESLKLDAYVPDGTGPFPAVILVHGGGWNAGDKSGGPQKGYMAPMHAPLDGTVSEITPMGDSTAKTYRIRIALPEDTPLKPGMSVEANVVTREKPGALLIPAEAAQGTSVFVVKGERAERRAITVGIRGPRAIEVLSGLAEDERVAVPFPSALRDGGRVRVTGQAAK